VTSYKALKESETKPGEFVTVIGAAGGLGHLAVQYAKAMGMRVIAMDVGQKKLDYAKSLGAEFAFDATSPTAIQQINDVTHGGSHGVVCLATHPSVFKTAVSICRRKGTAVLVGLPNASFELPIVEVVLKRVTVRGSIVGTRVDAQEALSFASRGLVKCDVKTVKLDDINMVIDNLREGKIEGRVVVEFPELK